MMNRTDRRGILSDASTGPFGGQHAGLVRFGTWDEEISKCALPSVLQDEITVYRAVCQSEEQEGLMKEELSHKVAAHLQRCCG